MRNIIKLTLILLLCIGTFFIADSFVYKRSPDQRGWEYVTVEVVNKWQSDSCSRHGCDEDYYFTILTEDLAYTDISVTYEFYSTTALFDKVKIEKSVGNSSVANKNGFLFLIQALCAFIGVIVTFVLVIYISEIKTIIRRSRRK